MNSGFRNVLACALFVLFGGTNVFAATVACDRACLKNHLDEYLNAVLRHDPSAAPLFAGFRETENAVVVRAGNGAWKTFTKLGKVQRRFLDTVNQSAGYFGTIEEGSDTDIVSLRLKIEKGKITEAEWIINRNVPEQGKRDPDNLVAMMPPDVLLPPSQRTPRDVMIAAANSYFDGIETHDGSVVMASADCLRIENGLGMAGARVPVSGSPGKFTVPRNCTYGFDKLTQAGTPSRRFPIVDEEAGFVMGTTLFIRAPGSNVKRNLFNEWFHIDHGKIIGIYAAIYYLPQEVIAPNWPPYEMNWPMPVTYPPATIPGGPPPAAPAGQNASPASN